MGKLPSLLPEALGIGSIVVGSRHVNSVNLMMKFNGSQPDNQLPRSVLPLTHVGTLLLKQAHKTSAHNHRDKLGVQEQDKELGRLSGSNQERTLVRSRNDGLIIDS